MNYSNCRKVVKWMALVGCIIIILAMIVKSEVLVILGFGILLAGLPVRIAFSRCPACKTPLPWDLKKGNYNYRCTKCGTEIEL